MDSLDEKDRQLDQLEEKIDAAEEFLRGEARAKGRQIAQRAIRKIDPVFAPLSLHADDAKVLFHPVDYVVFQGMNSAKPKPMKSIVLLDREKKEPSRRRLQRSIEGAIERGNYDWLTFRILDNGTIKEE
jgi:predicted Holliday junction resolvase-like endonuclease